MRATLPAPARSFKARGARGEPARAIGLADRRRMGYAIRVTRAKRERKEKAKADKRLKRASDQVRHEREAFAKKLEAARKAAQTTPATGIVEDE